MKGGEILEDAGQEISQAILNENQRELNDRIS